MKGQLLVVLVALTPLAAGAAALSWMYQDEGGIMALFGHTWLEDYPVYTMDDNPCPGFHDSRGRVPEVLVVKVHSADSKTVPPEGIQMLQEAADEALPRLDIRVVRSGGTPYLPGVQVSTMDVHVVTDGTIETWDGMKVNGFYCRGHVVQSVFPDHPGFTKAVFLHEFGHYLGLCHEDGTWMEGSMGAGGLPGKAQRWSSTQQETLQVWDQAGRSAPGPCLHR